MKSRRQQRVASLLKAEIAKLLLELPYGRIFDCVRITDVEISSDLKFAKVYLSIYSQDRDKEDRIYAKVSSLSKDIKRRLKNKLYLRYLPELKFLRDTTVEEGLKIDKILKTL